MFTEADRRKLFERSPTAEIIIGGVPAKCVIDTGAETSQISFEFYNKHLAKNVGKLGDVGGFFRLVGANHLEIPIDGYLKTQVEILGRKLLASFVVSRAGDCNSGNRRDK